MGRGDLAKVRSAKDRQRQKKARDAPQGRRGGQGAQGREEEVEACRPPPLRRYRGFMADSDRWRRFAFRDGDIVITTPSKCGTTWMQSIVGMLVLGTPRPGRTHQPALAVARHADRHRRRGLRSARAPAPPAVHQDPHAAGRHPPPSVGGTSAHLRLRDPSSARRGAVGSRSRRQPARRPREGPSGGRVRRPRPRHRRAGGRAGGAGRLPPLVHRQRQPADRQRSVRAR